MEHWRFRIKDSIYHYTDVTIKLGFPDCHSALHSHSGISLREGSFLKTLAPACWTESSFSLSPLKLSLVPRAENLSLTKGQVPWRRVFILLVLLLGQQCVPAFVPELRQQLISAWTLGTKLPAVLNHQPFPQCECMRMLTSRPAHAHTHTHSCTCKRTSVSVCTPKPAHVHTHAHACTCTRRFTLYRCCFSGGSGVHHLICWIRTTLYMSAKCEQLSSQERSGDQHNRSIGKHSPWLKQGLLFDNNPQDPSHACTGHIVFWGEWMRFPQDRVSSLKLIFASHRYLTTSLVQLWSWIKILS